MVISIISLIMGIPGCIVAFLSLRNWVKKKTGIQIKVETYISQKQNLNHRAYKITIKNNFPHPISLLKLEFCINKKPFEVLQKNPLRDYSYLSIDQILSNDSIWTIGYLEITNEKNLNKNKFIAFTDYGTFSGKLKQL